MIWRRAVTLTNVHVHTPDGTASSIRFGTRILALGEPPARRDVVIDGGGAWVLPGLINAHDHLELNHYGRQALRAPYAHVSAWVDDMRPRLSADPAIAARRRWPLEARVFAGALKQVLSGVTLVAHHNPLYPRIARVSPVKVLRRFGWAHSLDMEAAPVGARGERGGDVRARHRATPADQPFIVHAAEGVDERARGEIDELDARGVLDARTVLVHALAASPETRDALLARGVSLVWCPESHRTLFGQTWGCWPCMSGRGRVAVATDSRLTGARDLLDELRALDGVRGATLDARLAAVTTDAADLLRVPACGRVCVGAAADLVVTPPADSAAQALARASRADLLAVTTDGRPRIGHPHWRPMFAARGVSTMPGRLDGAPRVVDAALVRAGLHYGVVEPGLGVSEAAW